MHKWTFDNTFIVIKLFSHGSRTTVLNANNNRIKLLDTGSMLIFYEMEIKNQAIFFFYGSGGSVLICIL